MADLTTDAKVDLYKSVINVFTQVISEMRELSKKKPELNLSSFKVKQINRVLEDVLKIVGEEPEIKYIGLLDDEALPQNADAVLVMCQFEAALKGFQGRYFRYSQGSHRWQTVEYELSMMDSDEEA